MVQILQKVKELEVQKFETVGKEGKFGEQKTFLIDTPGLGDAERNAPAHLIQMVRYIKENELIRFHNDHKCTLPQVGRQRKKVF